MYGYDGWESDDFGALKPIRPWLNANGMRDWRIYKLTNYAAMLIQPSGRYAIAQPDHRGEGVLSVKDRNQATVVAAFLHEREFRDPRGRVRWRKQGGQQAWNLRGDGPVNADIGAGADDIGALDPRLYGWWRAKGAQAFADRHEVATNPPTDADTRAAFDQGWHNARERYYASFPQERRVLLRAWNARQDSQDTYGAGADDIPGPSARDWRTAHAKYDVAYGPALAQNRDGYATASALWLRDRDKGMVSYHRLWHPGGGNANQGYLITRNPDGERRLLAVDDVADGRIPVRRARYFAR